MFQIHNSSLNLTEITFRTSAPEGIQTQTERAGRAAILTPEVGARNELLSLSVFFCDLLVSL